MLEYGFAIAWAQALAVHDTHAAYATFFTIADEVRDQYFDELRSILGMHIQCHKDTIEDMKQNPENYN